MAIKIHSETAFDDGGRGAVRSIVNATRGWARGVGRYGRDLWRSFVPTVTGTYEKTIVYRTKPRADEVAIEIASTMDERAALAIEFGRKPYPGQPEKRPPAAPGSHLAAWAAVLGLNPWAVSVSIGEHGTSGIHAYDKAAPRIESLIATRLAANLGSDIASRLNRGAA